METIRVSFSVIDFKTGVKLAFHQQAESAAEACPYAPATPFFSTIDSLRLRLRTVGLPEKIANSNSTERYSYLVTHAQLKDLGFPF
jgi:hypothetical protein